MIEQQRENHQSAVLRLVGPFDLAMSLKGAASFLPAHGPPPIALRTGIHFGGSPAIIEVRQRGRELEAIGPAFVPPGSLRDTAAWLVNADLDLCPFYEMNGNHPVMGPVAHSLFGLKPLRPASLFEMLVIAITE
jgi:hypothetical protein